MMMNKLKTFVALAIAILAVGSSARAQNYGSQTQVIGLWKYNLNSNTEIFCALGPQVVSPDGLVASAASTSYTAASGTPYLNVAVGDYIYGNDLSTGTRYDKNVVVRSSSTAITVDNAVTPAGWQTATTPTLVNASLNYRTLSCGTGSENGVFNVSITDKINVTVGISQVVATGGIDIRLQCRTAAGSPWIQVVPALTAPAVGPTYLNYISATAGQVAMGSQDTYSQCRIGFKIGTADDGNDAGTNSEQISVWYTGRS